MTRRKAAIASGLVLAAAVVLAALHWAGPGAAAQEPPASAGRAPCLDPDYTDLVIPPNIAPLNFRIQETGARYETRILGVAGREIRVVSDAPDVVIPLDEWKDLLAANQGEHIEFRIRIQEDSGAWTDFAPVTNRVAQDPIDGYVAYRLMKPWYSLFREIQIRQRNLERFEETVLFDNQLSGESCMNCHSFLNRRGDRMLMHVRFPFCMVSVNGDKIDCVETRTKLNKAPFAYTAWHPNGRIGVFSVNKILQVYHTTGETRDAYDFKSDLVVYDFDKNMVTTVPPLATEERFETFPAWSPDGRFLYSCSASALEEKQLEGFRFIRYDLVRVAYDPDTDEWGTVETIVSSEAIDKSVTAPRISPDGRFAAICLSTRGSFPIFQPDSDIYLLDLASRELRPLTCNSEWADSWHSWSSNSRWLVFSSKRMDGVFTRLFICHIDENGDSHKAFVLPQAAPGFYDGYLKLYNVPELTIEPAHANARALERAVRTEKPTMKAQLDPQLAALLEEEDAEAPGQDGKDASTREEWPTAEFH